MNVVSSLTSKYGLGLDREEAPDYFIRIFVCFVPGALSAPWSDPRPGHPVVTPGSHVLPDVTACDAPVICHDVPVTCCHVMTAR